MLSFVNDALAEAETDANIRTTADAFQSLRSIGLDDFGQILLAMPIATYPKLSSLLPAMASDATQKLWTGNSGDVLLSQTCAFVRTLAYGYNRLTGQALDDASILDFGCGYGRIARLMYYFSEVENVWGVDPWDRSIDECRSARLGEQFLLSHYLPDDLPLNGRKFDLAYAFSVFTHLSERAALAALSAVRKQMKPGGVFCITIRPVEYWSLPHLTLGDVSMELRRHREEGFAFRPHNRAAVDGDITYGDTSMTLSWLAEHASGWKIEMIDRSLLDYMQRYVFLRAV